MEAPHIDGFSINFPYAYWCLIAITSIWIRIIFSWLRATESSPRYTTLSTNNLSELSPLEHKKRLFIHLGRLRRFWDIFYGCSSREPHPDFWYNTVIGTTELIIFPILIKQHVYSVIGGWLVFKTIGSWDAWKTNRLAYNRFIIINAIQLIVSFALSYFIKYPIP